MDIYLETGKSRSIAAAVDWPGWCRSARTEETAIQTLFDYALRYRRALQVSRIDFQPPKSLSDLTVVERLAGNATTDYGVPAFPLARDADPVDGDELGKLMTFLKAAWNAFDAAAQAASGHELRKGPRGGGRDLPAIVDHVHGAEGAYLSSLGGIWKPDPGADPDRVNAQLHTAIHETLAASVRGGIPTRGPRGGHRWLPRYFVRRLAWHVLDHAWEIEDRVI
jgi:hypothetical protein